MQLMIEVALYVSVLRPIVAILHRKQEAKEARSRRKYCHPFCYKCINYDAVCIIIKCTDVHFSLACGCMVADAETACACSHALV